MRPQREGGWMVVVQVKVKAAGTLPKKQPPPPLISPLLFTSLFLMYLFIAPAPPSLHPLFLFFQSLSSASPHPHFRCLTQRMFTPLCTSGPFFFKECKAKSRPPQKEKSSKYDAEM